MRLKTRLSKDLIKETSCRHTPSHVFYRRCFCLHLTPRHSVSFKLHLGVSMSKFIPLSLVLLLVLSPLVFTNQPVGAAPQLEDRWLRGAPGYERALQLQRELGLPLIVYFYTDWCPYCHSLEGKYLPTPPVREYLKGVIKVRINPEHGRPEKQIAEQYKVTGYPTFFVMRKPSSLPVNVNPFRTNAPDLTPAQFVSACQRGLPAAGLVSLVGVNIKPVPLKGAATSTANGTAPATPTIPNSDQPTLNFVLDRYVIALGGRDAMAKITSRVAKGRIDVAGVSFGGRLETYAKAPNMSLIVMTTESLGVVKRGFDGRMAWAVSDRKDTRHPSPKELAALSDDAQLYREIKLQELYPRIKVGGTGNVGTREVYILEATSRFGYPEKLYFDIQNGLLLRRDTMRPSSDGPVQAELYFSDWRDVDGIKVPFKITEQMPSATYIFTLEDVKHNVKLDDEVFRAPST